MQSNNKTTKPHHTVRRLPIANIVGFALAVSAIHHVPAIAQEGAAKTALEEIVVTAQKRTANVLDVPISMTVLSGTNLENAAVSRMEDFISLAPNVYVNFNDSIRATAISIRGILSDPNNVGIDPAVGVYVDGVYMARPTTVNVGMFDLQRVEVLRGPQGTIFGKNTIGGAIHFVSRVPSDDPEFSVTARTGNLDYRLLQLVGNVPISETFSVRASGQYEERDGFLTNLAGPDNNDLDNVNFRVSARYAPSDRFEMILRADTARDRTNAGANEILVPSPVFADPPFNSPQDVDPWDRVIKDADSSVQDRDLFGTSLELNWRLGAGTLTSITAYRQFDWENFQTSDKTEFALFGTGIREDEDQFSQELRYAAEHDRLNYVVGAYYFDQGMDAEAFARIGVDVFALFGGPLGALPAPDGGFIDIFAGNESFAAFGQIDYLLADNWTLTAGLRFTSEEKRISHELIGDSCCGFVPTVPLSEFERTDEEPSYTAGFKYNFSDAGMAYLTYSRGFKAGGYNAFAFALIQPDGTPADFEPEFVDNLELGAKAEFADGRVQISAALFVMDYTDLQVNQLIPNNAGIIDFVTSNAAEAESKGIEAELLARIADHTTLQVGYGYTDAEYTSFPGATPAGDDFSGNQLAQSPEHSLGLSVEYQRPVSDNWEFFARGEATHRSDRFSDPVNTPEFEADAYTLVNGRLGWSNPGNGFGVYLWGRNLTNEDYAIQLGPGSGAFSPGAVFQSIGIERTYGIEVTYDWSGR